MLVRWTVCLVATLLLAFDPAAAKPEALVSDDFNDNSLDTAVWTTNTSVPQGGASVTEQNERIELRNRGRLITKEEFDPAVVGPLRITGKWTFMEPTDYPGGDMLEIMTRCDGVPFGKYGDDYNGIAFEAESIDGRAHIVEWVNGVGTTRADFAYGLSISNGDTFQFEITDDGTNLSFFIEEIGDGSSISLTATSATAFSKNHVVFHNRERNNGGYNTFSTLDDVLIESTSVVPAPSGFVALVSMGAMGLVICALRRSRGTRSARKSELRGHNTDFS